MGYRVNSKKATVFRQGAAKTLRAYIIDGYATNKKQIGKSYTKFSDAIESVKKLLSAGTAIGNKSILELVSLFVDTLLSLDAYDKDVLSEKGVTKKYVTVTVEKLSVSIADLKTTLLQKGRLLIFLHASRKTV